MGTSSFPRNDPSDWPTWQRAREWERQAFAQATPLARLKWLESVWTLANASGALKIYDHRKRNEAAIARVVAKDWMRAKRLRLLALAESPGAFSSTLRDESAMADDVWRARASGNAEGIWTVGFIATVNHEDIGMVVGVRRPEDPACVEIVSLWVEPSCRRRHIGRKLIDAVCVWAKEQHQCHTATLEVFPESSDAIALYRSSHFLERMNTRAASGTLSFVKNIRADL